MEGKMVMEDNKKETQKLIDVKNILSAILSFVLIVKELSEILLGQNQNHN